MGKAIGAVVVGFIVWSVLHFGNMTLVRAIFPDAIAEDGSCFEAVPLLVTLAITFIQSVIAGAVCRLAAKKGQAPLALAILLTVVGIGVEGSMWHLAPAWYHISFIVMLAPLTLIGAAVVTKKVA
ncbi:MAG: hypothetical protein ED559_03865 [Phycisphaera sp.]|nr:MAG: hypothetical protein ED559_03865 [Phycisphaera sp.]